MLKLNSQITEIPGIGESKKKLFAQLGIFRIKDLIHHYPFRYEDTTKIIEIADLSASEDKKTIRATIENIKNFRTRNGKNLTTAVVSDQTGEIEILLFNQHFLVKILKPGHEVLLNGKVDGKDKLKLISPTYEIIKDNKETNDLGKITPIYPETKGLSSKFLRKIIRQIFLENKQQEIFKENLPLEILMQEKLISKENAIKFLHFSQSMEEIQKARERMAFEEIYNILKKVEKEKKRQSKYKAPKIKINEKLISNFIKDLPFELTRDQQSSINEVLEDLNKDKPMHRLLEGDVGSGKTLVAIVATLNTVSQGYQVAILAPTQVLAEQHYKTFIKFAPWAKEDISLITGNSKGIQNKNQKSKIKKNKDNTKKLQTTNYKPQTTQILIGTHAILRQADNLLENLGLVIIDEQHRFGVKQREFLTEFIKEWSSPLERDGEVKLSRGMLTKPIPHVLSMTATPIPRSLALTLYGDLDISLIEEMPAGRIPVETFVVPEEKRTASYDWIRNQVLGKGLKKSHSLKEESDTLEEREQKEFIRQSPESEGGQVFVICPLVEESEILNVKSVTKEYERLSKKIFPDLKIELLHGRIKGEEKERILEDFKNQKFDILVSTSVVEVGIDIPNATVIVVEGAERFGLAQLHQFRGRVGRSDKKSYCLLFTNSKNEEAINRLKFFSSTNKGLEIAEYDLNRRGPGEVYGLKQSGIPDLKFANVLDLELIKRVRKWF